MSGPVAGLAADPEGLRVPVLAAGAFRARRDRRRRAKPRQQSLAGTTGNRNSAGALVIGHGRPGFGAERAVEDAGVISRFRQSLLQFSSLLPR